MGRLDGPATTEQPALAELVVAQAGPVGGQVGAELGGHRGGQAGQPGHGLFHGRALSGPEAGVLGRQPAGGRVGGRVGESVAHAKFGEGVIVNIEGGGGNARAQINFGQHGMKVLDLGIAKLERLGR